MNCREFRDEMKAYIDDELGLLARRRVERHFRRCAGCREEMSAMADLAEEVRDAGTVSAPEGLREKVMGQLEFKPQGAQRSRRWSLQTIPLGAGVLLVMAIAVGALVLPRLRPPERKSVAQARIAAKMPPSASSPIPYDAYRSWGPSTGQSYGGATWSSHPEAGAAPVSEAPAVPPALSPSPSTLMIIKTADLSVRVPEFRGAYDRAVSIAKSVGGYITDSSAQAEGDSPTSGTMTVRVPVDAFERVIERLAALGKVQSRSVNGEDVTSENVDMESRLRNKRAEERQYLDIMNRAKRVNDIVTVSNELYRVRGEIEEIQGRLKYLKNASAMSTINLTLSEKAKPKATSGLEKTFHDAVGSLVNTAKSLAAGLIWLGVYAPVWGLPLLGVLYVRSVNRRADRSASEASTR